MAVTAVVLVLRLKCAALATQLPHAPGALWLALLMARAAVVVVAFLCTHYVRAGGLGSALVAAPRAGVWLAVTLAIVVCMAAGVAISALCLCSAAVVFVLWRRACMRRLDGMTGDTCGALVD